MTSRINHAIRQWLASERDGDSDRADRALGQVFALLPLESVPSGFAEQVLARAGMSPVGMMVRRGTLSWGLRAAISLCLISVALFLMIIPGYLPALLGIFHLGRLADVAIGAFVGVVQQLGVGLVIWRTLSAAGSIVSSVMTSPPYLAALALGALMSLGALRILHEVMISERSSQYVGSG